MNTDFHPLRVIETRAETKQATTVLFDVPAALRDTFLWKPGQHVTLRFNIVAEEVRRPYSISDSPVGGGTLRVTIKRHTGGLVSNHVNDHVTAGDVIDVMPPFGGFFLETAPQARRTHYFFCAGSGITPIYAMIRSVLAAEPHSVARLAYGNVNADSVIFREELARLEEESQGRLTVRHILSSPSWLSSFQDWRRGRIDARCVADFISEHPPYAQDAQYYLCGPGEMNAAVRGALMAIDVPDTRIHMENYLPVAPPDDSVEGVAAEATVRLKGTTLSITVSAGETVLNAVRAATATPPPYSCESGVCGACRAQLRRGKVHLRARMALTDAEISRGAILTCQALPITRQLTVEYDWAAPFTLSPPRSP